MHDTPDIKGAAGAIGRHRTTEDADADSVARALDTVVRDQTVPIAFGLAGVYAVMSVVILLRDPELTRWVSGFATAAVVPICALLGWLTWRRRVPLRHAHAVAAAIAAAVLASETLQFGWSKNPFLSFGLSLVIIGVGVVFLSRWWLLFFAGCTIGCWCIVALSAGKFMEWVLFLYLHLTATVIGAAVLFVRRRNYTRIETLRRADQRSRANLKRALAELAESEQRFRQFAEHSDQVFWMNDARTGRMLYINPAYERLTGRSIQQLRGDPQDWLNSIHPDDRDRVRNAYLMLETRSGFDEVYRITRPDDTPIWVHDRGFAIRDELGQVIRVAGIVTDITGRKQSEALREGQGRLLEMIATRQPLQRVLDSIALLMEQQVPGMLCSILLLDEKRRTLRHGSAPSLPAEFAQSADGLAIGPDAGSCGAAAYRNERVIVTDTFTDPKWAPARELVRRLNLRACWSQPIVDSGNAVRGTLAMYDHDPRAPTRHEVELIEIAVYLAGIALERQAQDNALRESEARFRKLVQNSSDIITVCDASGVIQYESDSAARILGRSRDSALGRSLFEFAHEEDVDGLRWAIEQTCAEPGGCISVVFRRRHHAGRWVYLEATSVNLLDDATIAGIVINSRDVTERVEAATALQESRRSLNIAQAVAHIGSWEWDVVTNRVVWSPEMHRIVGVAAADFDGTFEATFRWVHPEDRAKLRRAADRAVHEKRPRPLSYRIIRPDGEQRIVWADGEFTFDEQGNPVRMTGFVQDITRLRRAEAERRRLEAELRQSQKLEAIGTLASGVAHDFNNLLTAINGYVGLAVMHLPDEHPSRAPLKMILGATNQAGGVTQSLLTFAHRTPSRKAPVDLVEQLRQSTALLRRVLPASVELVDDLLDEQPLWIEADANQLTQVWMNLAINARDAMPGGGKFIIRVRRLSQLPQRAEDSWAGDAPMTAVVTLTDTGVGMTAQVQRRIFEPFFTTKPRGRGTGLGLSITHGIIADHDGRIRVHSTPGRGTRFMIYLPCCDAPVESDGAAQTPCSPVAGHGELVLLAEDNDYARAIITSSLHAAGYRVVAAEDGHEAMHAFEKMGDQVRLAILDLDLPGRSGEQCLAHIRRTRDDLPVMIVTGNLDRFTEARQRERVALIAKPFQVGELVEAVGRTIESQRHSSSV